jgi:hypothetical protein
MAEINQQLGVFFRVPFKTKIKIGEIVKAELFVGGYPITLAMSKEAYNELLKGTKVSVSK